MTESERALFPNVVYKYRNWDDLINQRIISNREIYFSSPKCFVDHRDCNLKLDFSPVTKNRLRNFFRKIFISKHPNASLFEEKQFIDYYMRKTPLNSKDKTKRIIKAYKQEFYQRSGVFSVTDNPNNLELWNMYANRQQGFCIGIDFDWFRSANFQCSAGKVSYYKHLPKICPVSFIIENKYNQSDWYTEIYSKKKQMVI